MGCSYRGYLAMPMLAIRALVGELLTAASRSPWRATGSTLSTMRPRPAGEQRQPKGMARYDAEWRVSGQLVEKGRGRAGPAGPRRIQRPRSRHYSRSAVSVVRVEPAEKPRGPSRLRGHEGHPSRGGPANSPAGGTGLEIASKR